MYVGLYEGSKSWAKAETVQAIVPIPLYPVRFFAALAFVSCAGIALVALAVWLIFVLGLGIPFIAIRGL